MKKAGQENINHLFRCLLDIGVEHIFISPGSRNAPLINGAFSQKKFQLHSVVDERSAAYMAMGSAQANNKPAVVITTSGTAVLNLFPAVAEAHNRNIPLIVLTADRPLELQDRWENQTINQKRVFGKYVNRYIEWKGIMELKRSLGRVEKIVNEINTYTQSPDAGVVHVNFHLSEPLYFSEKIKETKPFNLSNKTKGFTPPKFKENTIVPKGKTLILSAHGTFNGEIEEQISKLIKKGAAHIADLTSPYRHLQNTPSWDLFADKLDKSTWEKIKPDTLITTGSYLLNKTLKNLIRESAPKFHIHIADTNYVKDTFFSKPSICKEIGTEQIEKSQIESSYIDDLSNRISESIEQRDNILRKSIQFNDISAVQSFISHIPENSILHLANSMSIRYSSVCDIDKSIRIYSNRGTSGIDGCISTAVGSAIADKTKKHYLICGDLAFFYDSNGLWINPFPENLVTLVLNNQGGNIFNMIPGPKQSDAHNIFIANHNRTAEKTASDFGLKYQSARTNLELENIISESKVQIIEIHTSAEVNTEVWSSLKQSL